MTPEQWAQAIQKEIREAQEEGHTFSIHYDCASSCCLSFRIQSASNPDGIVLWSVSDLD